MTATAEKLGTRELRERLRRHYIKPGAPLPGGIFLPEVGWNGVSGGGCDAIYVGFTSTSGRILVGHELKVSRADWLNELRKPGKADRWADQCHQWYLVVNDPAIVQDGELPAGWGLMVPGPSKTRMRVVIRPATRSDHTPSWQAVRSIMARQDTLRAEAIREAHRLADDRARAEINERVDRAVAAARGINPEVECARQLIGLLKDRRKYLSGVDDAMADAVCEVLDGRRLLGDMQSFARGRLNLIRRATDAVEKSWEYKHLEKLLAESATPEGERL